MKKFILIALSLLLTIFAMAGCDIKQTEYDGRLSIVATIFPEYDWVHQIIGTDGEADLTLLLDNGVDLHSYQPTADDIITISTCDMFIYVGGESDEWVEEVLAEAKNKDMVVINLLDVLGDKVKEEEIKEGMQEEEEEDGEEGPEYDEHVWLSLRSAAAMCEYISAKLCEIDEKNAQTYKTNTEAYIAKLNELDRHYSEAVGNAKTNTLLFGDRFPFRYMADDYGLDYYAAFAGCSAECEASFETILFLAGKVDDLGLKAIMQIESADGKIANTIKETTTSKDQKILTMDSMQSATAADINNGATYLGAMEKNLTVLKEALEAE